jgi:hypothetical protein
MDCVNRMRTKLGVLTFGLILIVTVIVAACRQQKEIGPLVPADYRAWQQTTAQILDYPVPGHENNCRRIYINDAGAQVEPVTENGRVVYDYPDGTIIVKEIYEGLEHPPADAEPTSLTVMLKQPAHPQARNGWLWIVKDGPDGEERIIEYDLCNTCHANANEPHPYGDGNPQAAFRDYVYFPPRRTRPPPAPTTTSTSESSYQSPSGYYSLPRFKK